MTQVEVVRVEGAADERRPRRRMSRLDRRAQLLEVAEQCFGAQGFSATSMDEVADRAGVSKPVLYDHYGSKDGLLAAVLARSGEQLWEATVRAVTGAAGPAAALAAGLRAYFEFIDAHHSGWSMLLTETAAASAAAAALEEIRDQQAALITGMLAGQLAGLDQGRAAAWAQAIVGACERLAYHRRSVPIDVPEAAQMLMDLFWQGLERLGSQ